MTTVLAVAGTLTVLSVPFALLFGAFARFGNGESYDLYPRSMYHSAE